MVNLDEQQVTDYLRRIDAPRPYRPDAESLATLQYAHLQRVPFENLDIHRGVPIVLDLDAIADKIIGRNRGGYCYELNSLFAALLEAVGYSVDLVSARVASADGKLKREFGHMALVVHVVDRAMPFLVDVGFGDGFTTPIPIDADVEVPDRDGAVRLRADGSKWSYEENGGGGWQLRYAFTLRSRRLSDYAEMNEWQQTSPESKFTSRTICSMLTDEGRATISGNSLIITRGRQRVQCELSPREIERELHDRFGLAVDRLPDSAR